MKRAWLQPGQPQLVQPFTNGAFRHRNREPAEHFIAQIGTAPAHDMMDLGVRAGNDQCSQLGHLGCSQFRSCSRGLAGYQSVGAGLVEPMDPITEGLAVHAGLTRCFKPGTAFQHHRDCQQPPGLCGVGIPRRQGAKGRGGSILAGYGHGCAHIILRRRESPRRRMESHFNGIGNPGAGESLGQGRLV